MGLSRAWLSSLVPADQTGIDKQLAVEVLNPLSKDHQLMRQSLVPGLINACGYNQDQGTRVWLFEYGRVYFKELQKREQKYWRARRQSFSGPSIQANGSNLSIKIVRLLIIPWPKAWSKIY